MKHRLLITTLASVMLSGGTGIVSTAIANTQTVQASTPSFSSSYWTKNKRIYVTKKTTFKRYDALKGRIVSGRKIFKAGRRITVRNAGEFDGWVLAGTKSGSRYWWVNTSANTKWLSLTKPVITRSYLKGRTYQDKHGIKATIGNATNVKTSDGQNFVVVTATVTNNSLHAITPSDWLTSKLSFLSANLNKDKIKTNDIFDESINDLPSNNQWSNLIKIGNRKLSSGNLAKIAVALQSENTSKTADSLYITPADLTTTKVITIHPNSVTLNK